MQQTSISNYVVLYFSENNSFTNPSEHKLDKPWSVKYIGSDPPARNAEDVIRPQMFDSTIRRQHFILINNDDGIFIKPCTNEGGVYRRVKPDQRFHLNSISPELYLGNTHINIENNQGTLMAKYIFKGREKDVILPQTPDDVYIIGKQLFTPLLNDTELVDPSMGFQNCKLICTRNSLELIDFGPNINGSSNGTWVRLPNQQFYKLKNNMQIRFGESAYMKIKIMRSIVTEAPKTKEIPLHCVEPTCKAAQYMVKLPTCTDECSFRFCKDHKDKAYDLLIQGCPVCNNKAIFTAKCHHEGCSKELIAQRMSRCKAWCTFGSCEDHRKEAFLLLTSKTNCPSCNVAMCGDDKKMWRKK